MAPTVVLDYAVGNLGAYVPIPIPGPDESAREVMAREDGGAVHVDDLDSRGVAASARLRSIVGLSSL